jgi:hypothetical protein
MRGINDGLGSKEKIILGFGNGSYRTKAAIYVWIITGNFGTLRSYEIFVVSLSPSDNLNMEYRWQLSESGMDGRR